MRVLLFITLKVAEILALAFLPYLVGRYTPEWGFCDCDKHWEIWLKGFVLLLSLLVVGLIGVLVVWGNVVLIDHLLK